MLISGRKHLIWALLGAIVLLACEREPLGSEDSQTKGSLFLAGSIGDRGAYWVDGTSFIVSDSEGPIESIFVFNSDVYLAGSSGGRACYWKNGAKILLPSQALSNASSIFVSDGDVYVSGYDRDNINEPAVACFWKNGFKASLSSNFSTTTSIFVLGLDVYVGGQEDFRACYWKNGFKTQLSDFFSDVRSMFAFGVGVYVGGYDERVVTDYFVRVGWYWYDQRKHELFYDNSGNLERSGDLNSLYVDNLDVYIAGRDNWTFLPIYWKNGSKVELPAPNPFGTYATCISVLDREIIVGGYYIDTERGMNKACYWHNSQRIDLPGDRATVTSIYIRTAKNSAS